MEGKMPETISFGYWVRRQRKALDLTQQTLAHRVDCAPVTIRKIESDSRRPSRRLAERLAEQLAIPPHERSLFMQCAAGERSPLRLALPEQPVAQTDPAKTSVRTNLPAPVTLLVGRDQEVAELCALLQRPHVRLVTLTGPGGVGKTQLAFEVARRLLVDFADGIFVTHLATIHEAALVTPAIAQTLEVRKAGNTPLLSRLQAVLRQREQLLVLDNFEHVVEAAPIISALLAACPLLEVLVTSRQRLRLQGEHEFITPALAVPDPAGAHSVSALAAWPAVELFCQRAQAAHHGFALNRENASAIAAICVRLDGLPLAIELAAAHTKMFSPQALVKRISTVNGHPPTQWLKADTRDAPGRHRSLWDTIAWSYALLTPEEQILFRRLAVFTGGCTLDAATFVCNGLDDLSADVLDGIAALVDKNLLCRTEQPDGDARFVMLETIREFGLAQLQAYDEAVAIQQQHANYYVNLATVLRPQLMGSDSARHLAQMRAEYPNIRAAFQWLLAQRAVDPCLQFCTVLLFFWTVEHHHEAESYLQATLALAESGPPSPNYANTLAGAGYFRHIFGDQASARHYFEQSLAMNKATGNRGDPKTIGMAYGLLAWTMFYQGDYQAADACFAEAQKNDLASGDEWALAMTLTNRGKMAAKLGEFGRAHTLLQEAIVRHRGIGKGWGLALALANEGLVYLLQQQFDEALSVLAESQAICQTIQEKGISASMQRYRAIIAMARAEFAEAGVLLTEALTIRQEFGMPNYLVEALETAVHLALRQQHPRRALSLAAAICNYRHRLQILAPPVEGRLLEDAVTAARQQISDAVAASAWAAGEAMALDEAVAYALEGVSQ
jgi:predicted ATPase/transcriptional regulator with XRE-family HTH domain